ncbi:MAG TPA: transcription termination factor Rho, partial [Parachlamydiales bacterium]|nr:transcription termination factor Rho [Parachlamydiales bacterium]
MNEEGISPPPPIRRFRPHPRREEVREEEDLIEEARSETTPKTITKISDLQRMNIDQLNLFAKHIGLTNLGSLTRSQMVFEIVKAKSSR